jgi:hypothetical protein
MAKTKHISNSTGPITPEGKSVVALNALSHGLTAQRHLVPGESAEEYSAFRLGVTSSLSPSNPLEEELADRIAQGLWRLKRIGAIEAGIFSLRHISAVEEEALKNIRRATEVVEVLPNPFEPKIR